MPEHMARLKPDKASAVVIFPNPSTHPEESDRDNALLSLLTNSFNAELSITAYIHNRDSEHYFFGKDVRTIAARDLIMVRLRSKKWSCSVN